MEQLLVDYESGDIDSTDVKLAFQKAMNKILEVTVAFLIFNIQIVPNHMLITCARMLMFRLKTHFI